jgi:glucose-6-phosphate 1-dehydrogenase
MRSVDMDFPHSSFNGTLLPEAYERLLLEALQGDASLFTRSDELEAAWQLVDPILQGWMDQNVSPLATYRSGDWGPDEADQLLARNGHLWRLGCMDEPA